MSGTGTVGLLPLRLGIGRIDVRLRLALAIGAELIYMWFSRDIYASGMWFSSSSDPSGLSYADVEILRTPLRLGAAAIQWLLMADVVFGARERGEPIGKAPLCAALLILFCVPVLVEDIDIPVRDAWVIAVASFPVGMHEELFFRGIVQTLLVKRLGAFRGICIVVVLFALFHVGVTDPDAWNFAATTLAGAILCLLYWRTGSLAMVVLVHAIHDALYCVTWASVVSVQAGVLLLFVGAYLLLPPRSR